MGPKPSAKTQRAAKQLMLNTAIHGAKYVVEDERHFLERLFWVLFLMAGLGVPIYFGHKTWQQWSEMPVITTLDTAEYNIKNIPFPAVTFCHNNLVDENKLANYAKEFYNKHGVAEPSKASISSFKRLVKNTMRPGISPDCQNHNEVLTSTTNVSLKEIISSVQLKVGLSCAEMLSNCRWKGDKKECSLLFQHRLTDHGLCCSFNTLTNRGDDPNDSISETTREGLDGGLTVMINLGLGSSTVTQMTDSVGIRVLIHHRNEFPFILDRGMAIESNKEAFVHVSAIEVFSDQAVIDSNKPLLVGCHSDGYSNPTFQTQIPYDKNNCIFQCERYFYAKELSCLPSYYATGSEDEAVCNSTMHTEYTNFSRHLRLNRAQYCKDCLPNCNQLNYKYHITTGTLSAISKNATVALNVLFGDKFTFRYKRSFRYTWDQFLAAIGGLLGLGLGFSILNAAEIIYFFTLRR